MDRKFRKGEVVWAKVRGFPWWPGVVKHIALKRKKIQVQGGSEEKELMAIVDFIGDNSHVELPLNKLEKFNSKFEEFSKTKKKLLIKSIIVAKKIIAGEIPFEKHCNYVKKKLDESMVIKYIGRSERNGMEEEEEAVIPRCDNGKDLIRKRVLGLKRMRKKSNEEISENEGYYKVKPKNIKINININVNNNSNNTLNITSFSNPEQCKKVSKIIDDELDEEYKMKSHTGAQNLFTPTSLSRSEYSSDEDPSLKTLEDMKQSISELLRYKIEMPASSSNKYILTSLNQIERQIHWNTTYCTYKLTKELLPVLTSFLSNKNTEIFIKSSEILTLIKDKILNEIFECGEINFGVEKDCVKKEELQESLIKSMQEFNSQQCDGKRKHQMRNNKQFPHDAFGRRYLRTTRRSSGEMRANSNSHSKRKRIDKKKEKDTTLKKDSETNTEDENNIVNELNHKIKLTKTSTTPKEEEVTMNYSMQPCDFSNENVQCENLNLNISSGSNMFQNRIHKIANIKSLSSKEVNFLFNGFISEESMSKIGEPDIMEKLQSGVYCNYFYQNIYNKYNGLDKKLANRRKHVCLKLLNILKLILPEIDQEALKKAIVYLEYNIRTRDPTLGSKYKENIENFYDRIKEILNLTSDTLKLRREKTMMMKSKS